MVFNGMDDFLCTCREQLCDWYANNKNCVIYYDDTFVVWSAKVLQNKKCILSTNVSGDGVLVEFTYNGDKQELYMDVYEKVSNTCLK